MWRGFYQFPKFTNSLFISFFSKHCPCLLPSLFQLHSYFGRPARLSDSFSGVWGGGLVWLCFWKKERRKRNPAEAGFDMYARQAAR
jgi:hypothetical protein